VKEKYSDYKEIHVPEKKSFVDKMLAVVGNTKKSKFKFDTTPEIPPMRGDYDEYEDIGLKGKGELRKKKTTKSKTKRKSKKKTSTKAKPKRKVVKKVVKKCRCKK